MVTFGSAMHFWRLAKQDRHRQIHWLGIKMLIVNQQVFFVSCFANNGIGTAFALTNGFKTSKVFRLDRQYITLLRLITPDRQWAHARFIVRHIAQFEFATRSTVFYQFREGVGSTTVAPVVDKSDWIGFTLLPTAVNNFVATAFDCGVLALYRREIQIF